MRAYFAYDEGGIQELGETSREQVLSLIERAEASLTGKKQFGVGLYRDERDFLEITPVGRSQYLIWSDIILNGKSQGFVARFLGKKRRINKIVDGRDLAAAAAYDYMECSREEFERRYS